MSKKKDRKESHTEFMSRPTSTSYDKVLELLPGYPGAGALARRLSTSTSNYDKKHVIYNEVK